MVPSVTFMVLFSHKTSYVPSDTPVIVALFAVPFASVKSSILDDATNFLPFASVNM